MRDDLCLSTRVRAALACCARGGGGVSGPCEGDARRARAAASLSERSRDDVGERPANLLAWQQRRAAFRAAAAAAGTEQSCCAAIAGGARSPSNLELARSEPARMPPYARGASAAFSHALQMGRRMYSTRLLTGRRRSDDLQAR